MHPFLQKAVADLYRAFKAKHPAHIDGCPCCTNPAQLRHLAWHGQPREQIAAADLDFYARKAMTTVGTANDFRYFLPRVFELCLAQELETDTEVVFGKLACGHWRNWPKQEQDALEHLGQAIAGHWTLEVRNRDSYSDSINSWVCSLGQYLDDLTPHLDRLLEPTDAAQRNFKNFCDDEFFHAAAGKLNNPFWEKSSPAHGSAISWLTSPRVQAAYLRLLDQEPAGSPPSVV